MKDCDSCEFYDPRNDRCSSDKIDMCELVASFMLILKQLAHLGLVCPGYIEKEKQEPKCSNAVQGYTAGQHSFPRWWEKNE